MSIEVTMFTNVNNIGQPIYKDIYSVLDRIKSGASKDVVRSVREATDNIGRNELKKKLPAICFSGKFSKRLDDSLIEHSGIICLDFDKYNKRTEMYDDKEVLSRSKYVFSVFISPSGNGLKVLVKIPKDPLKHKNYFNALHDYFKSDHFDTTSKNISRVCYESYDPSIYINKDSATWTEVREEEYKEVSTKNPVIPIKSEEKIADILVKWWAKNFPMTEGNRNNSAFTLAMSLNEFGVSKSYASLVLSQYVDNDFTIREINGVLNNAYEKNADKFKTKFYEDVEFTDSIRSKIKSGEPKKDILHQLESSGIGGDLAESIIERIETEQNGIAFWEKNDKGVIKMIPHLFKDFLEDAGFYKFYPDGTNKYVFVKVTNNLIDNTNEDEIKDFVLDYLIEMSDKSVYNFFAERIKYFDDKFLSLLSPIDVFFISDSRDAAYLYYRNCAVQVTEDEVNHVDYIDLGGFVWKSHIIDRIYTSCEYVGSDFERFVRNVCKNDENRIDSLETTAGYLLHGYKKRSFSPAVIFNDELISDNPEGGTGKGLMINAISQIKKVVIINGKQFDSTKTFAYQLVSADTQILCFDDVKKGFNFEFLFSDITEGVTLEKKNRDAIKIPFEKSPKIAITTNYAINGKGNSFERRKWELEFFNYYKSSFTPEDEFGKMMFSDWNEDEWCQFDMYMIKCLQKYLKNGLMKSKFVNLDIRKLSAETCHEFIEYCGLINGNKPTSLFSRFDNREIVYKKDIYEEFVRYYPDFAPRSKRSISRMEFNKWLTSFAIYKEGIEPEEGRDPSGQWIRIKQNINIYVNGKLNL
jgi:hypothetical protein